MTLFEIFNAYRNGNKDVFNQLARDRVKLNNSGYYDHSDFTLISPLDNLSDALYREYAVPYKRSKGSKYPKYYEAVYNGSYQDMRKDVVMILFRLFNDESFTVSTEEELYGRLKYAVTEYINKSISISAMSVTDETENEDGETCSLYDMTADRTVDIETAVTDPESQSKKEYLGCIKELQQVIKSCDISALCVKNAAVQQNIIRLITKYYMPHYNELSDMFKFPKDSEMRELYCREYGHIEQSQYSRALNNVFKMLCDCTTSLNGYKLSRTKFQNDGYYIPTIRCVEISETDFETLLYNYEKSGYHLDKDIKDIMNIVTGTGNDEKFWHLSSNGSGYSIIKLKKSTDSSDYRRFGNNNNTVVMDGNIICIKSGKCKLFVNGKHIFSYAADKELFYIKRAGNNYIGYALGA